MKILKQKKLVIIILVTILLIALGLIIGLKIYNNYTQEENNLENIEFVSQYFNVETLETEDDFLSIQNTSNEIIIQSINNNYSLENADVIINPYGNSSLSAVIIFDTDSSEEVTLEMYGESYIFESSSSHVIPVYGLISGEVTTVTLIVGEQSKEFTFDMSEVVFDIDVDVLENQGLLYEGVYLFTNPMEGGAYAINENGDIVWHLEDDYTLTPIILDNGHLLLSSSDFSSDLYSRNGIVEIDYLGKIYNYYEIEGGYHHDMELLPNGNLLVSSTNTNGETSLDYVTEINLSTGKSVNSFDLYEIISLVDPTEIDSTDWLFNNGVSYDENTNSVLFTSRLKNAVISVDYDTHEINWIFSDPDYWSSEFDEYLISYDGEYPLGMHSAEFNSDGDLIMFNNNYDKSDPLMSIYYTNYNSSAVIYNLDFSTMSAKLVSEFDDNESFYSYAVSTYKQLGNSNYLLLSGWQIDSSTFNDYENLNYFYNDNTSTIYELDEDNNILFKADISISAYAVTKTNFYSDYNINVDISDLNYSTNYDKESYTLVDLSTVKDSLENAEDFSFSYVMTDNVFSLNAGFANSDAVNLYFISSDGIVYKYKVKEAYENLNYFLDIKDIDGELALFLEVNGTFYNYNVTYNFR